MIEIYKIQTSSKKYLYDNIVQFEKQWNYLTGTIKINGVPFPATRIDDVVAYKLDNNFNWQEIRKDTRRT